MSVVLLKKLNKMKVSVIIPCYNFEDYIEQSILSAVSQKTNFEFEILVRDDMSSDNSQVCIERVATFNPNVKYFKPEENWGFKNIKFLIEQCKGEYIAWLDGDDYWTDIHKLQKQVDFLDTTTPKTVDLSTSIDGRGGQVDLTSLEISQALGKKDIKVMGITDKGFAQLLMNGKRT